MARHADGRRASRVTAEPRRVISGEERRHLEVRAAQASDVEFTETRTEGCACGGVITARPDSEMAVLRAVRLHQAAPRHEEWRRLGGLTFDRELMGRTVRLVDRAVGTAPTMEVSSQPNIGAVPMTLLRRAAS